MRIYIPEKSAIDFVELCSSDQAAVNLTGKNGEAQRKFAIQSFNSLSVALTRS